MRIDPLHPGDGVGSLPGAGAFVLLGAPFEADLAAGAIGLDLRGLAASATILVFGIASSGHLKRC